VSTSAQFQLLSVTVGWLGSRVVSVLDSGTEGPGVEIAAATLSGNSLRQTAHTHCASVHQAAKLIATLLRVAGVTAGLAESSLMAAYCRVCDVTCRLTVKNHYQLRTLLHNRAWATFTFLCSARVAVWIFCLVLLGDYNLLTDSLQLDNSST